jgi:hypothetical protein
MERFWNSICFYFLYLVFFESDRLSNLIVSEMRFFLILKSRGLSVEKDGLWLTSRIQGFRLWSNMMSKPSTSKHMEFSMSSG